MSDTAGEATSNLLPVGDLIAEAAEKYASDDAPNARIDFAAGFRAALDAVQRPFPVDGAPMGGHPSEVVRGAVQPVTPDLREALIALNLVSYRFVDTDGELATRIRSNEEAVDALLASGVLGGTSNDVQTKSNFEVPRTDAPLDPYPWRDRDGRKHSAFGPPEHLSMRGSRWAPDPGFEQDQARYPRTDTTEPGDKP